MSFTLGPHDGFLWATSGRRVTSGCTSRALLLVTALPPRAAPPLPAFAPRLCPRGLRVALPALPPAALRWIRGKKPSPERHSRFRPFCNLVARPSPALNPWPPPQPAMLLHGHHAFVWLPPLLETSPPSLLDSPLRARPATPARPCPARFPFPIIVRPPPRCVLAWLGHP